METSHRIDGSPRHRSLVDADESIMQLCSATSRLRATKRAIDGFATDSRSPLILLTRWISRRVERE